MMAKVVYNADYGGFGLSEAAIARYAELKGLVLNPDEHFERNSIPRHDSCLVQVVEELGTDVDTEYSDLRIREVPDGSRYRIHEYDGFESVILESEEEWCVAE